MSLNPNYIYDSGDNANKSTAIIADPTLGLVLKMTNTAGVTTTKSFDTSITPLTINNANVFDTTPPQKGVIFNSTFTGALTTLGNVVSGERYTFDGTSLIPIDSGKGWNYLIAASDATAKEKKVADFVCNGANDATLINNAITQLFIGNKGGSIELSSGNFTLTSAIKLYNTTLSNGNFNTATVNLSGKGMHTTFLQPDSGINAIELSRSTQCNAYKLGFILAGSSVGIKDIELMSATDGIGWRQKDNIFTQLGFYGDVAGTHTGFAVEMQIFRTLVSQIYVGRNLDNSSHPSSGLRFFAAATPNTSASFNSGDSIVDRFHITVKNGTAIQIDAPVGGDSSYFNQTIFRQGVLRTLATGTDTAVKLGVTGGGKVASIKFEGLNFEDFNIGIDCYNAQGCTFDTFYTSLSQAVGQPTACFMRQDINSKNNYWKKAGIIGIYGATQNVIIDNNTDLFNPNIYEDLAVETTTGSAFINNSASDLLPAGVIVRNPTGIQRGGTRHTIFRSKNGESGVKTLLSNTLKIGGLGGTDSNELIINRTNTSNNADIKFTTAGNTIDPAVANADWAFGTRTGFGSDLVTRHPATGITAMRIQKLSGQPSMVGVGGDWSTDSPLYPLDIKGDLNVGATGLLRINAEEVKWQTSCPGVYTSATTVIPSTVLNANLFALVDAGSGNISLTLPNVLPNKGKSITLKRIDNTVANTITLVAPAGVQIDQSQTKVVCASNLSFVTIISDGTAWWIISN